MKKTAAILILSALGLSAAPEVFAQNVDSSGFFVSGNAGRTSIKNGSYDGGDSGYSISTGYRWGLFSRMSLGFEVGYNDLGNIEAKNLFNDDQVVSDDKSKLHGWTVGLNQRFDFSPRWYGTAHGGLYGWKGQGLSNDDVSEVSRYRDLDKLSWYAGAGFGYNITDHASIGLNYDHYAAKKLDVDLSTNMSSVSLEYRF